MIEPTEPMTIWVKHSSYPAYLLASDEGAPLQPSSVILRHRHLRQQQRIIQGGVPASDSRGAKPTRGVLLEFSPPARPMPASQNQVSKIVAPTTPPNDEPSRQTSVVSLTNACPPTSLPSTSNRVPTVGSSTVDVRAHPPELIPLVKAHERGGQLSPSSAEPQDTSQLASSTGDTITTSIGPLQITRTERLLRSRADKIRGEKTVWFSSTGADLLDVPPALSAARIGDLFIHRRKGGSKQVWLWTASSWVSVELFHPHPYLQDYILNFGNNDEPSWVTKETMHTYQGHAKKREREGGRKGRPMSLTPGAEGNI